MTTHVGLMVLFSLFVSIVFATMMRDEPAAQLRLGALQRCVGEVGGGGGVSGERRDHRDLRTHGAGAHDEDPVHAPHRPAKAAGRFSRKALAPSALSSVV